MTIYYPDISSFQAGIDLKGALAVCCKATEGNYYANSDYARAKANAASHGTFFFAYHFLVVGGYMGSGGPAAQAQWAFDHAGKTPLMLDVEREVTSKPGVSHICAFVDAYRKLGGVVWLVYLPRWYWQQIGSPSLQPLVDRDLLLVSSDYVTYSESGGGWDSYGGMTPVVWQYTDSLSFNGRSVDFNAYRGTHPGDQSASAVADTLAELKAIVTTGKLPAPPAPPKAWYWHADLDFFSYGSYQRAHASGPVRIGARRYYYHASPAGQAAYFTRWGIRRKPSSGTAVWL